MVAGIRTGTISSGFMTSVSVSVPPISEEERAEIARQVKKLGEDATVAIRAIWQEARQWINVTDRGSQRRDDIGRLMLCVMMQARNRLNQPVR
jgi:ribosome recycling factor